MHYFWAFLIVLPICWTLGSILALLLALLSGVWWDALFVSLLWPVRLLSVFPKPWWWALITVLYCLILGAATFTVGAYLNFLMNH